jgi:hypothetical protein
MILTGEHDASRDEACTWLDMAGMRGFDTTEFTAPGIELGGPLRGRSRKGRGECAYDSTPYSVEILTNAGLEDPRSASAPVALSSAKKQPSKKNGAKKKKKAAKGR